MLVAASLFVQRLDIIALAGNKPPAAVLLRIVTCPLLISCSAINPRDDGRICRVATEAKLQLALIIGGNEEGVKAGVRRRDIGTDARAVVQRWHGGGSGCPGAGVEPAERAQDIGAFGILGLTRENVHGGTGPDVRPDLLVQVSGGDGVRRDDSDVNGRGS